MRGLGTSLLFLLLWLGLCLSSQTFNERIHDDDEDDEHLLFALCVSMFVIIVHRSLMKKRNEGVRGETIFRKRRNVEDVMYELGQSYVKRYFRMETKAFWKLVKVLTPKIKELQITRRLQRLGRRRRRKRSYKYRIQHPERKKTEHRSDHNHRNLSDAVTLPRDELLRKVSDSGLGRRIPKRWRQSSNHLNLT